MSQSNTQPANSFNYQMLGRLQRDCEYVLGAAYGNTRHLHYDTIDEQISEMKALYNSLPSDAKPEWMTMADIEEYESRLNAVVALVALENSISA